LETFQVADRERLAEHRRNALFRYKDIEAGFSLAHEVVYNVECPMCKMRSGSLSAADPVSFIVERPLQAVHSEGFDWVLTRCSKCDFRFRVILQR
jgi:hypothetical protein